MIRTPTRVALAVVAALTAGQALAWASANHAGGSTAGAYGAGATDTTYSAGVAAGTVSTGAAYSSGHAAGTVVATAPPPGTTVTTTTTRYATGVSYDALPAGLMAVTKNGT